MSSRGRSRDLEELYEDEFDGFIEFENDDEKLELLREERALLESYEDEERRRPTPKARKSTTSGGVKASTAKANAVKKITRKKASTNGADTQDEGPKLPLKYRRIEKYTDKQMGFHVLHQALSENKEFSQLSNVSLDGSNEKQVLTKRLNIYLDTLHDWCRTVFPDMQMDEALSFMESQSFSNRVHKAMEWGRSTFSSRYQQAIHNKEQRKRKRGKKGQPKTVLPSYHSDEDEIENNRQREKDEQNDDDEDNVNKDDSFTTYRPKPYSQEDGEEEFQFEDDNTAEPSPKKKKRASQGGDNEEQEESTPYEPSLELIPSSSSPNSETAAEIPESVEI